MTDAQPQDLVVLAADKHISDSLETLLDQRQGDLGIRKLSYHVRRHPHKDPGCRTEAAEFLRPLNKQYKYALVVFDLEGCGSRDVPEKIRENVEADLGRNGWRERSKVIIIDPELEAWVWSRSGRVAEVLGWGTDFKSLEQWLIDKGFWKAGCAKPQDPKRALKAVLRHKKKRPISAALFKNLTASIRFNACCDTAFNELKQTLRIWFPKEKQ